MTKGTWTAILYTFFCLGVIIFSMLLATQAHAQSSQELELIAEINALRASRVLAPYSEKTGAAQQTAPLFDILKPYDPSDSTHTPAVGSSLPSPLPGRRRCPVGPGRSSAGPRFAPQSAALPVFDRWG